MKEKIAKWFKQGLWTKAMVINAVQKCIITDNEANKILSKEE